MDNRRERNDKSERKRKLETTRYRSGLKGKAEDQTERARLDLRKDGRPMARERSAEPPQATKKPALSLAEVNLTCLHARFHFSKLC